jgi:hypothetical protein
MQPLHDVRTDEITASGKGLGIRCLVEEWWNPPRGKRGWNLPVQGARHENGMVVDCDNMSKPSVRLNVGIRIKSCFHDKIMRFYPG